MASTGYAYTVEPVSRGLLEAQRDKLPGGRGSHRRRDLATPQCQSSPLPVWLVLNLLADDDALRQACLPNLLHVAPSARMKADAVAQWQKKKPTAQVRRVPGTKSFTKFAAGELNNRFRKAAGSPYGR